MAPAHLIPEQKVGEAKNYVTEKTYPDTAAAKAAYKNAVARMMNPAAWHSLHGAAISGRFMVCDAAGNLLATPPVEGNYLKLGSPAPDNTASEEGHDWVRVERITHDAATENGGLATVMTVRASPDPTVAGGATAHFFADTATSTFCIAWSGLQVSASVHGRNEQPNTAVEGLAGKARNAVLSAAAMFGYSLFQWKPLTAGFLAEETVR